MRSIHVLLMAAIPLLPLTSLAQPLSASLSNSSYLTTANTATLTPPQFTLEASIRPDGPGYGNGATGVEIIDKPRQGATGFGTEESWSLAWVPNSNKVVFSLAHAFHDSGEILVSNASVSVGQAAHLTATFDGTTMRLYINGVLDNTLVVSSSVVFYDASDPILLGAGNYGSGFLRRFQGLIDDVRIWDHALNPAEVSSAASCDFAGPRTGLLVEYNFDTNLTVDVSGHGRDATLVGTAAVGPNICGLGTACSAVLQDSNYLTTTNTAPLNPQQITLEAWVRPDGIGYGNSSNGAVILAKPRQGETGAGLETCWDLGWNPTSHKVYFEIGHSLHGAYESAISTSSILIGQSVHIAGTFDGSVLRLYVNGVLESSVTATSSTIYSSPQDPVLIGAGNYGAGFLRRFQGAIDDVRIWDHVRTPAEINSNAFCRLSGAQTGLLANWVFDGFSTADVSGQGRDASFANLAAFSSNLGGGSLPSISSQPLSTSACASGAPAQFTVSASPDSSINYLWQWQPTGGGAWLPLSQGGIILAGGGPDGPAFRSQDITSPTLSLFPTGHLTTGGSVRVHCVLSNGCGSVTSDFATATICPADFNCDGSVDFFDYDDFVVCFEGGTCPPGTSADFDGDGSVDFFDYDAFVTAFEAPC